MSLAAFLNPLFLWGAGLLAVPLIIHLINRRRYRTVTWAAMDFVLRAYKKKNRRMRLENLLLLLLRCAIPVLLALAMARPFFGSEHLLNFIADQRRDIVLVVDESYSMNRRTGPGTLFQAAVGQARRLLDLLDPERGDTCTVLSMGNDSQVLMRASRLRQEWDIALNRLEEPRSEEANFPRLVAALEDDVLPELPGGAAEIFVISDFQRRTFETPLLRPEESTDDERFATLESRLRAMHEAGTTLHLVNVSDGLPEPDNLTVTDLRAAEPLVITHQNVRFTATVRNHGSRQITSGTGRFRFGEQVRPVTFSLDKEGQASVEVYHSFSHAGDHRVEFELDEDDLTDDNQRRLRVAVRESIPVLVVDGEPVGSDPLEGEVGQLLPVLDHSFGLFDGDDFRSYFRPSWVSYHEFNRGLRLDDYAAVILANVPEIDQDRMTRELDHYVRRGGGVWFFLGDRVVPDSYNQRFYSADGSGLLPMPLAPEARGEVPSLEGRRADQYYRLEIVDELHPMVRTFVDDRRRKYISTPVFRYLPFQRDTEQALPGSTRVPLRFQSDGDPALVDHVVGRGHAVWLVFPADEDWSLFPRVFGAYFPLVWDVVNHLVVQDPGSHHLSVGDAIRRSVPFAPNNYTITKPGGEVRTITHVPGEPVLGHFPLAPFDETSEPGFYQLDVPLERGLPLQEVFAVNVASAEGDLQGLDREQWGELLDPQLFEYSAEISPDFDEEEPERQGEIWKSLMTALLVCLIVETLLAWRFGAYS